MRALLFALLLLPLAAAHGGQQLDDTLVKNGQALMIGSLDAPQPGALLVVPFVDGPLPCGPEAFGAYRIALTSGTGVAFVANATILQMLVDMPEGEGGYSALAVDTHEASRALLLMQQAAVSYHALVGVVKPLNGTRSIDVQTGVLGLPYPLEGTATHGDLPPPEGEGIQMAHDRSFRGGAACLGDAPGTLVIRVNQTALPESLAPGKLVHVVALHDPSIAGFLPRPLDGTTGILRANLYLARAGDDAEQIRAALDPAPRVADITPIAALAVGLALVVRRAKG